MIKKSILAAVLVCASFGAHAESWVQTGMTKSATFFIDADSDVIAGVYRTVDMRASYNDGSFSTTRNKFNCIDRTVQDLGAYVDGKFILDPEAVQPVPYGSAFDGALHAVCD
jgi:hypothetical protein